MTGKVLPFDASAHLSADALLPFYVNATLNREQQAFVEQHLETCEQCQQEVRWLRTLFADLSASAPPFDAADDRASVMAAVGMGADAGRGVPLAKKYSAVTPVWARWLLAAQLAAIFFLGAALLSARDGASYRTLGAASAPARSQSSVAVMFDPTTTEPELRRIVVQTGARISDGPTPAGVFVLQVEPDKLDRALQMLRAERAVRLAEPLAMKAHS
jgi:anti-sigma factor RsiW